MKHLKLTRFPHNTVVLQFLESCPELKHLSILKVVDRWFEPKWVPACMLTNLTTIKISKCQGMESEMDFIKYMLGNAEVLKTVTVTLEVNSREDKKRLCALLLELPRASRCCEVHFTVRK
ncbi:putative FBD-associated F-box protein At5g38565 [Bidens hawaiensis]|uniref:putative FBD-associated F-box protein At5g38565 n=1 Tax=Bidens hawaiensis TaxID=980011 RepID=UPI0040494ED9